MKKYNDMVITLNEIFLPYSTVTLKSGTQLDSTEWANKLMEDPKTYIFLNDLSNTSDEDKIVNKLVQQMEKSKLVPKTMKDLEKQIK